MDIAYRFRLGLVMAIVLACPLFAQANGAKFPEVAFAKMPEIPQQRAMIVWQDGVETLVVETSYKSESPDVGWVLPIPAKPTKLDIADAGMLTSLSICLQPRITHDLSKYPQIPLLLIAWFLPFVCVVIFVKERDQRRKWALAILLVIVFCVLVAISAWGSVHTAEMQSARGPQEIEGITQLSRQRLGNYDVAVLKADDSDALSQWLKSNSLKPLDAKGKNVVDDYIARKWCFVVARLHRETGGLAAAHPIAVTFPAAAPVYPMKMTSLAGSDTRVELFVISDRSAAADGFQCVTSNSYRQIVSKKPPNVAPYYVSKSMGFTIGSPEAGEFMWPGCVVTKLTADLSPEQMDHDVAINLTEFSPYQQHLYSASARRDIVLSICLWGVLAVILALAAAFNKMRRPRRWELPVIALLAGLTVLASVIVHTTLPVIPVGFDREHGFFRYMHIGSLHGAAEHLASDGSLHSGMSHAEFAAFPTLLVNRKYFSHTNITNPFFGEKIRYERSPGNFSSRKIGDKTFFCIYDQDGVEWRVELQARPMRRKTK
ncbi:MAG: DUF2330 domain-containing protein [Phycisphaerae bacterium]|nr:DUF2330 domain-containing protein [Phycisphaerae bacterium]